MSICFKFHCHCSSGRAASVTFIHNWYKTLSQITGTRHQIVNILTLQGLLTLLRMLILRGMTELPRIWVVKVGGSVAIASPEKKRFVLLTFNIHILFCVKVLTWNVLCTHSYTGITWANITIVNKAWVLKTKYWDWQSSCERKEANYERKA